MQESKQGSKKVCVDRRLFLEEVSVLVKEVMDAVEGKQIDGGPQVRSVMCGLVDRAGLYGEDGVLELLVYDLIRLPVLSASDDEPLWYLTLSLNAGVPKEGKQ